MDIRTVKQIEHLADQIVMVRADFNVPIEDGKVKEDYKIVKSLPTIKFLMERKARIILVSHLGRPEKFESKYSLAPVRDVLEKLLQVQIKLFKLDEFDKLEKYLDEKMFVGQVVMLENIRFSSDEEKNTNGLAKNLSELADLFVLDGFAVAHRNSASVSGVARHIPAFAGLLLEKEIVGLSKATENPKKPFVVMLGGVKMETKIPVLKNLLPKADKILLGGGIFSTLLAAQGHSVGQTVVDESFKKEILSYVGKDKIIFPVDVVVGDKSGKNSKVMKVDENFKVPAGQGIYDIGPETIKLFSEQVKTAETLVWNGAMGYFEQDPYQHGTYAVARLLASRSKGKAFGIAGGGETVEVLEKLHLTEDVDLVSTGGGAMLEFLSGKELPGVKIVQNVV